MDELDDFESDSDKTTPSKKKTKRNDYIGATLSSNQFKLIKFPKPTTGILRTGKLPLSCLHVPFNDDRN